VVAYNRITQVADGLSYPGRNCDVFGNDILNVTDDGIEPDYSYANNRFWGNRLTDCSNFFFSFQPMYCGPWYIVRNQCSGVGRLYKFNGPFDRFLAAHNTFVIRGRAVVTRASALLASKSRNNLYISDDARLMWDGRPWGGVGTNMPENNFTPDWKTDVDYDGFDFGELESGSTLFTWGDRTFTSLKAFSEAVGIEQHAIQLDKREIFVDFQNPADYLPLRTGSKAIDVGAVLPGLNSDYRGEGPDLGAFESGQPLPHYGPRDASAIRPHNTEWVKW
jgi:hypothetical protein